MYLSLLDKACFIHLDTYIVVETRQITFNFKFKSLFATSLIRGLKLPSDDCAQSSRFPATPRFKNRVASSLPFQPVIYLLTFGVRRSLDLSRRADSFNKFKNFNLAIKFTLVN